LKGAQLTGEVFRNDNNESIGKGNYVSFTQYAKGIALVVASAVNVVNSFSVKRNIPYAENKFSLFPGNAIWDTGATKSVITQKIVDALALPEIGVQQVSTVGGILEATEHLVDLWLPNGVRIIELPVLKGFISPTYDILIGMDVISTGDFCITNFQGKSMFTFRMPSVESIDFSSPTSIRGTPPRRNVLCPCGSGKKYKYCCGK
jgi:hypothetical protein